MNAEILTTVAQQRAHDIARTRSFVRSQTEAARKEAEEEAKREIASLTAEQENFEFELQRLRDEFDNEMFVLNKQLTTAHEQTEPAPRNLLKDRESPFEKSQRAIRGELQNMVVVPTNVMMRSVKDTKQKSPKQK
jgi:hypothetical protein